MIDFQSDIGRVPNGATQQVQDNLVGFPQSQLDDLRTSIQSSRGGPIMSERNHEDRK